MKKTPESPDAEPKEESGDEDTPEQRKKRREAKRREGQTFSGTGTEKNG